MSKNGPGQGDGSRNGWFGGSISPDTLRQLIYRLIVLLTLLAGLKFWLFAGLSRHLYHSHWRITGRLASGFDYVNFYLFAGLFLAGFVFLGRSACTYSSAQIRTLNARLGTAGLVFVFFSFCQFKALLYPYMEGILELRNVGSYLIMNLFFAKPFLILYLLGYALIYGVLFRLRREDLSFYFLGSLMGLYLVLNLRELVMSGTELLIINCFGVAGLFSFYRGGQLGWKCQLAPFFLMLPGWILLGLHEPLIRQPDDYFFLVACSALALAVPAGVALRHSPANRVLSHFLPFHFAAFLLLANQNYPLAENYDNLIIFSLSLPFYFYQEMILAAGLFGISLWLARVAPKTALILFDLGALAAIVLMIADIQVTQKMGVRPDWNMLVVTNNLTLLWRTIKPFAGLLFGASVALILVYGLLVFLARIVLGWRWQQVPQATANPCQFLPLYLGLIIASGFLWIRQDKAQGLGLVRIVATSPAFSWIRADRLAGPDFVRQATELGLIPFDYLHTQKPAGNARDLNVIVIVMESMYNRYLSLFGAKDDTQPLLSKYRDRMELFPNFYSVYPNSLHARFAVLSGLYPTKEYVTYLNPMLPIPNLFEIFHNRGYVTSLFDSCFRDYVRFGDYVQHRKLDYFYDCDNMPGREKFEKVAWGILETATLEAMQQQLAMHARQKDRFCLAYLPVAPHFPFDNQPAKFRKFFEGVGSLDQNYTGLYKNQLLFMDWIISSLIDTLADLKLLDSTLVVITNDHGEMVGENKEPLGHGWCLEPKVANNPLIVMNPGRQRATINYTLGSQVDILPTILDILNVPLPTGHLYQGVSLYSETAQKNRRVLMDSFIQRAIVEDRHFVLEDPQRHDPATKSVFTQVYAITNSGVKTIYEPVSKTTTISRMMNQFESLQKSFVLHYPYYQAWCEKMPWPASHDQLTPLPKQ